MAEVTCHEQEGAFEETEQWLQSENNGEAAPTTIPVLEDFTLYTGLKMYTTSKVVNFGLHKLYVTKEEYDAYEDHKKLWEDKLRSAKLDEDYTVEADAPYEISLDLDSDELPTLAMIREVAARYKVGVVKVNAYMSKSGKHWHVVIKCLKRVCYFDRMQIALGLKSDIKREYLSLMRAIQGKKNCWLRFRKLSWEEKQAKKLQKKE